MSTKKETLLHQVDLVLIEGILPFNLIPFLTHYNNSQDHRKLTLQQFRLIKLFKLNKLQF